MRPGIHYMKTICISLFLSVGCATIHPPSKSSPSEVGTVDGINHTGLTFMENVLASIWTFGHADHQANGAKPDVSGKCSVLDFLLPWSGQNKSTWKLAIEFIANEGDLKANVSKYSRFAACILTPAFVPKSQKLDESTKKNVEAIVSALAEMKNVLTHYSFEMEADLFGQILDTMKTWNIKNVDCFAMRLGLIPALERKLQNPDMAIDILKLADCPMDMLCSPNPIESLKFYLSADPTNTQIGYDLVLGAVAQDNLQFLHSIPRNLKESAFGRDFWNDEHKILEAARSDAMIELLFEKGLSKDDGQLEFAVKLDSVTAVRIILPSRPGYAFKHAVHYAYQYGSQNVLNFLRTQTVVIEPPSHHDFGSSSSKGSIRGIKYLALMTPFSECFDNLLNDPICLMSRMSDATSKGHLHVVQFFFDYLMKTFEIPGAPFEETVYRILEIVTGRFYVYHDVKILEWLKAQTDFYGLEFPPPKEKDVRWLFKKGDLAGLLWYQQQISRPVPFLDKVLSEYQQGTLFDIYDVHIKLQADHYRLLEGNGIVFAPNFEEPLNLYYLETAKYLIEKFPEHYSITTDLLCEALRQGNQDIFLWASSKVGKSIRKLKCKAFPLHIDHLPLYVKARKLHRWYPVGPIECKTGDRDCQRRDEYMLGRWAFEASKGRAYPKRLLIRFGVTHGKSMPLGYILSATRVGRELLEGMSPSDISKWSREYLVGVYNIPIQDPSSDDSESESEGTSDQLKDLKLSEDRPKSRL